MKKNGIFKLLFCLFAAAFLVIAVLMVRNYLVAQKAESAYDRLQEDANTDQGDEDQETAENPDESSSVGSSSETSDVSDSSAANSETVETPEMGDAETLTALGVAIPEKSLDWDALKAQNADIYAWIYIPGTNVDYPIVRSETDNTWYLNHNLDGSEGYPGCIYTENYNKADFSDRCTVIYGHNMKDLSMFHTLHSYEDPDFFASNPYVYIYLPDGTDYAYEIFAATAFSDVHLIGQYKFTTDEELGTYLNDIYNIRTMTRNYRDGLTVGNTSHIITLSTCVGTGETERYLVNAVLLNDPNRTEADILSMFRS